ncbi:hypothetical protein, partial [Nonomuraea insulae]
PPLAAPTGEPAATGEEPLAAPAVRGRHPFTPPSRTRAFRGGANGDKLVYSAVVKGESNGVHNNGAVIRYGGLTLSNIEQPPGGDVGASWQEYWRELPDDDDPEPGTPIRAVARLALLLGVGLLAAGLIWAVMNARDHPVAVTKTAAQTEVLLEEEPADQVPAAPAATAAERADGSGLNSVRRKAALPKPAPPVARLSPSSAWLGSEERTGSFSLSCTGRCEITSATGTDGIDVSGTRFRVGDAYCLRKEAERGKITVRWTGRTTGDGRRTGGTTTAQGSLTMNVAWNGCR